MGNDKDGLYCQACGGIPPEKVLTKRILIDGKEIGIDQLDWIISEVKSLSLPNDESITNELLRRTRALNYVPTKRTKEYGEALLREYKATEV